MKKIKVKGRIIGFETGKIYIIFRSGTRIMIFEKEEIIKNIRKTAKIGDIIELSAESNNITLNPKIVKKPSSLVEIDNVLYI